MKVFATSINGVKVLANTNTGHLGTHIADTFGLEELARSAIQSIHVATDGDTAHEYVFARVIGECDLQETSAGDDVVYAIRLERDRYTRFVKTDNRHACSSVTVIIKKVEDRHELWSAWIGHLVPSFPKLDAQMGEDIEEKAFWATHALVWGNQAVDESTITKDCPW